MTSPQTGSRSSGLAGTLQEKIGPLKTWQWLAIVTAAGLGWLAWQRHTGQAQPSSSTTTGNSTSNFAGEQQIPQFIIQNQMPTSEPSTNPTTPTTTSSAPAPKVANGFYRNVSQQGYGNIYEVVNGKRYHVSEATWKRLDKGKSAPKVTQIDNSWVGFQLPKQSVTI